jgi:hypothetical protein
MMKQFKSTNDGDFAATLVQSRGKSKSLSLHGTHSHVHITVPPHLASEAGRLMRRDSGDAMLELAERCITHEVEEGL